MRALWISDSCRGSQVHAVLPVEGTPSKCRNQSTHERDCTHSSSLASKLADPIIEPYLKPVDYVQMLADIHEELEVAADHDKAGLCLLRGFVFKGLGEDKLVHRSIGAAVELATTCQEKVVCKAWLQWERRGEEPDESLASSTTGTLQGRDSGQASMCSRDNPEVDTCCSVNLLDEIITFTIGSEEVLCGRQHIASLSIPFDTMLNGCFTESRMKRIDFSQNDISAKAMQAVDVFSKAGALPHLEPNELLELLTFANRFCCENVKSACDSKLAKFVQTKQDAIMFMEYGLEESAEALVASCLEALLCGLPSILQDPQIVGLLSRPDTRMFMTRFHASYALYGLLGHVAMEEDMGSDVCILMLQCMKESASSRCQKAVALHQLGCAMFERKQYSDAHRFFEEAAKEGHLYSMVGLVRTKSKLMGKNAALVAMEAAMRHQKPIGWLYVEKALYCNEEAKVVYLNVATELDPTLTYPYKYRAVKYMDDAKVSEAITEINRILGFKISTDCLELRVYLCLAGQDYAGAIRDVRALLTLSPNYTLYSGRVHAWQLLELLLPHVDEWSMADCWMQLYDRWSSVDDIGSLAVVHQMLEYEPGKALLFFRQSLLLLRLNCPKTAMRSLQLACENACSEHERLVYEGWILYDTGYRKEAVEKAQASIDIQRSFEAFFLKAYALADTSRDIDSSMEVVEILKEALKCPSDGLRKGQALNNLGSVYVDCGKLDLAADCYVRALEIRHTRAHQGLARVFYMRNDRAAAHKEMTKLIEKAKNNAFAYEKRSEYCERDRSMVDLNMVTRLDPLRTYPYRYRAAEEKRRLRSLHQVIEDLLFSPDQNDELIVWRSVAGLEDGRSRNLLPLFSFHLRNGGFPVTRRTELSKKQRQHSTLPLQVFVKMLNGSTCIVRVGHADSIASLFSTVSAKEGVPVCLLRLIFAGKQLDGGKSIKDYDIAQDSSISVVLRLRGGMSGRPKSSKGQSALSGRKLLYSEANATSSKPDARVHENPVFQEEILAKEVSEANSWDIDGKVSKSDRDSAMLEIIQADKRGFPSLQEAFEANRGSPNKPPVKSRRLDISMDVDLLVVDKDAELMEDVVLETQQPGGNMDCVQQPVPRKSAWGKPPGSNDWSFLGHKTDDYEAIKSSMLKDCKAAFISKRDFLFPEGHTRRVLKAPVAITADQLCTRYIELSECGLFFYFMGRVPFEDDFKRWFKATFQGRCLIKQIKWIGRGFYQVIVGSIQQRDFILGSAVGFNGNFVYTIPWRANFNPADLLAHECPVWVSFPKLSPLLEDEVESIAETLGKVLYVGKGRRACVLWNREKEPPEFLELTTSDGLDLIVEVSFATFPDSCFLCKQAGHFARFCPMAENRKATYAAASGRVPTKPDAEVNLSDKVNAVVTPPLCTMEGSVQEGKGKNKAIPDFFHKSLQNKEVSQDSVAEVLGSDKVNGSGQVVPQSEFTVVQGNKNKGFPSGPRGNTRRSQGSQGRRTIRDFVNKFAALEDDYGLVHVLEDVEPTSPSLKNEGGGPF